MTTPIKAGRYVVNLTNRDANNFNCGYTTAIHPDQIISPVPKPVAEKSEVDKWLDSYPNEPVIKTYELANAIKTDILKIVDDKLRGTK